MRIRFWGVRGSIPTPSAKTVKYGGNTSCIQVIFNNNKFIIIDAGTGIRALGNYLIRTVPKGLKTKIFLTHTHWDHIQGFPFFLPAYIKSNKFEIYGPVNFNDSLETIVAGQMKYIYFPVKLEEMQSELTFKELKETIIEFENFKIITRYLNHPIMTLGYRIEYNGKVFCTVYDNEPYQNLFKGTGDIEAEREAEETVKIMNQKIHSLIKNADLVVHDAQYTDEEYKTHKGWGHSTYSIALKNCIKANVKKLVFFHHDPERTDKQLDEIYQFYIKAVQQKAFKIELIMAKEGLEIKL